MRLIFFLLFCAYGFTAYCQQERYNKDSLDLEKKAFQKHGLHQYWLVLIKPGEQNIDADVRKKIMESHFANMKVLADKGVLKMAGPMGKNELGWSGIFIFDCPQNDLDEYLSGDDAINTGYFATEIAPWYAEPSSNLSLGKAVEKEKLQSVDEVRKATNAANKTKEEGVPQKAKKASTKKKN